MLIASTAQAKEIEINIKVSCYPRAAAVYNLNTFYNEELKAVFVTEDGLVYELFGAPSGEWSLAFVLPEFPELLCGLNSGTVLEIKQEQTPVY